jgi:hypothetical protein
MPGRERKPQRQARGQGVALTGVNCAARQHSLTRKNFQQTLHYNNAIKCLYGEAFLGVSDPRGASNKWIRNVLWWVEELLNGYNPDETVAGT